MEVSESIQSIKIAKSENDYKEISDPRLAGFQPRWGVLVNW
jgi:hypothetical protein